ncbi:MAG: tetratricopeptide repeat protein [Balneolaceae bacterium]
MCKTIHLFVLALFSLLPLRGAAQDVSSPLTPTEENEAMNYFIQGVHAFENEEFEEALDYLNLAYLRLPDQAGINYALADAYFATGDLVNAVYYAEQAVEIDPENKWYYLLLASIYRQAGRNNATVETLETARAQHPNDLDILLRLASLYSSREEYQEANKIYGHILSIRGDNSEIHMYRYQNYMEAGLRDSATSVLLRLKEIEPDNLNVLHTLSQHYLESGDREKAVAILELARERNPRNPETLILLADLYIQESDWDRLGNTFVTMIEDPLISPSQKMELARFIYSQQQSFPNQDTLTEQTRRVLNTLSDLEPDYGNGHLLAAEFHLNRNETEEAINKLSEATRVMPEMAEAWQQKLQLMFSAGKYEQVIEAGKEASEHVSDDAFIQFFTGASLMLTGEHESAAGWLEDATLSPARSSFRSVIFNTLADTYMDLDRWDDAVDAYESAIRLDSNNHNALNNYAYYLSEREERLKDAEEMSLKSLSIEPENAAYLDTAGWIYFKLGELEKALEYIHASIETGSASAEVLEHLGDVYEELGEMDEALHWWNKALEEDPGRTWLMEKIEE